MCGGMNFLYKNPETRQLEARRVFFPQPHAQIPVLNADDDVELLQWGRRQKEEDPEYGVPVTGWAKADKLKSDFWQRYNPEEVLIPAFRFSEKGKLPKSKWFDMPEGTFLMGLKIHKKDKSFIYVVTNPAIGALEAIHPRMPLVVNKDFSPADFEIQDDDGPEPEQKKLF